MDWKEVTFPKHFKPLPPGYQVMWTGSHYIWKTDEEEGVISWDRFWVRRCAFAHYEQNKMFPKRKGLK